MKAVEFLGIESVVLGDNAVLRFSMFSEVSAGQCAHFRKSDCFESLSPHETAA